MIWQYIYKKLQNSRLNLDFEHAILVHSGGWKKLINEAVDKKTFNKSLFSAMNIRKIHNFYGMVEQVGSIYVECEYGYMHTSNFSDIIIRDPMDLSPIINGTKGVIEILSVLPRSYPGHVLLTEDVGKIIGVDDCLCGRNGKYFEIIGRLPKAEIRGCSDTFEGNN